MNHKSTTLFALASSATLLQAGIPLSDVLTIEGFVDTAYSHVNSEFHTSGGTRSESENSFDVDQVEIDFLFDRDALSARVDVQSSYLDSLEVEQAYFDYDLGNGGVVSAGRYDSWLGFEAYEPTGRYQYSGAYNPQLAEENTEFDSLFHAFGLHPFEGDFAGLIGVPAPRQHNGLRYAHTVGKGWVGVSLQDGHLIEDGRLGGDNEGDGEDGSFSSHAIEIAAGYAISKNLRAEVGGFAEDWESGDGIESTDGTNWGTSGHLVFEQGTLTLAAELFYSKAVVDVDNLANPFDPSFFFDLDAEFESYGAMVMANLALNEGNSITGRLSHVNSESTFSTLGISTDLDFADYYKATVAYNHALTANLLIVTEVSYVDGDLFGDEYDSLLGAIEAIFTF